MSETVAEQSIAPFFDPNRVDFLFVDPEDAREAGKMFRGMCIMQIQEAQEKLVIGEWTDGLAEAVRTKQATQQDGSDIIATITARETLAPGEPRPPQFDERENTPGQILIRSATNTPDSYQKNFVVYSIDEASKLVHKQTFAPGDVQRLLEQQAQEVQRTEGQAAVDAMFATHAQNEAANAALERELGVDTASIVGTSELTQLQILLDSMQDVA